MNRASEFDGLQILTQYEDCAALAPAWNEIVATQSDDILQLDVTCTFEWAMTLWRNHLEKKHQRVIVFGSSGEITGILPLYQFRRQVHRLPCRVVAPLTELYSGRCGFLLKKNEARGVNTVFAALRSAGSDWDVFQFALTEGSRQHQEFLAWWRDTGAMCERISHQTSPYIPLQENWVQHFASLPKKLRSTIRNGEKRMREHGRLEYREFREQSGLGTFVAAALEIEKDSWKEAAGTSLTTNSVQENFHTDFLQNAARSGWLCCHLLLLDGEPVAHIYGLLYNGFFFDLKESYKSRFREMSPGHVLKAFAFESLYRHGARVYDFMGVCEEYKMKWTDKTYSQITYLLYNRSLRGWAAYNLGRFKGPSRDNALAVKG